MTRSTLEVSNESFYASAGQGTVPLVVLATAANKFQSGSATAVAPGTLATNANKLYLMTSQRDVLQTFGNPTFYSVGGSQQYDNELNEVGLFSLYHYLGIANSSYAIRADIDLAQLRPSATPPVGTANNGDYWLDLNQTFWGVFRANGNPNSAYAWAGRTPTVISNTTDLEVVVQGRSNPKITSASASVISTNGILVINDVEVQLTAGDSISTVVSKINNTVGIVNLGISATTFARVEKYALDQSSYGDVFNIRLVSRDIATTIYLTDSTPSILTELGLIAIPFNIVAPAENFGNDADYAVDAVSTAVNGTRLNSIWEKVVLVTSTSTKAWWFKVGSIDGAVYPGWGWREAEPRVLRLSPSLSQMCCSF